MIGAMTPARADGALRADARRNRDAVVAAARAAFSEKGLDAPLDAVAAKAGVGRGTVYRHFPTREDLVEAIHDDNLDRLERVIADAADPADAFIDFLTEAARLLSADRGFAELLRRHTASAAAGQRVTTRLRKIVAAPLAQAQRAGRVRPDLRPDDVLLVLDMLGGAALGTDSRRRRGRERRALELMLDALRHV
jgi:AcrR family transcriptional regulator